MLNSQTRFALRTTQRLAGAIRVQYMYERHFTCLTASYAKNSCRLAIRAALHNYGDKSFPFRLVVSPLLAGVFRHDPHRPMF
jgi:hypothetical protein